jgi:predicted RNase H-like nuclease
MEFKHCNCIVVFDKKKEKKPALTEGLFVGVDGCKGGWIAAILRDRKLQLYKYCAFSELVYENVHFDGMLVEIPKMREIDEFLLDNRKYMNVIRESHPEVCFARMYGRVLLTNKSKQEGICERVRVLSMFLPDLSEDFVRVSAKSLGCKPDDVLDAICLAVTANLDSQGKTEVIPEIPSVDDKGLTMQMVIPKG